MKHLTLTTTSLSICLEITIFPMWFDPLIYRKASGISSNANVLIGFIGVRIFCSTSGINCFKSLLHTSVCGISRFARDNSPCNHLIGNIPVCHIEAAIRHIATKSLHGQEVAVQHVLLAKLHHRSAFSNAPPGLIKQIPSERVDYAIYTLVIGGLL